MTDDMGYIPSETNEFYKEKLVNPKMYDRVATLIMMFNSACKDKDWAYRVINTCIGICLQEDGNTYKRASTGMCQAIVNTSNDYDDEGKIDLYFSPLCSLQINGVVLAP